MKTSNRFTGSVICRIAMLLIACPLLTAEEDQSKKLKIVFMMGQSNMVGYANPNTAWYITQPTYVPP